MPEPIPISILILVKNEEEHLPKLLKTLDGFGEIVVFDSLSTDRTLEIAEAVGCKIVQRAFDDWASHQNWAVEHIEFKYPWVFYLDADERMTPEVRDEIATIAQLEHPPHRAYFCRRKNYLMGRWLKRSMSAGYVMRFFQPPHIRFTRKMSVQPVLKEPAGYLKHAFVHYHFSRGFQQWFEKHNWYAALEADEWIKAVDENDATWKDVFSFDGNRRVQALKHLSYRLPFRPAIKFAYMYLWRLGFLDGKPGFHACMLMAVYEYMVGLQVREKRRRGQGLDM